MANDTNTAFPDMAAALVIQFHGIGPFMNFSPFLWEGGALLIFFIPDWMLVRDV